MGARSEGKGLMGKGSGKLKEGKTVSLERLSLRYPRDTRSRQPVGSRREISPWGCSG